MKILFVLLTVVVAVSFAEGEVKYTCGCSAKKFAENASGTTDTATVRGAIDTATAKKDSIKSPDVANVRQRRLVKRAVETPKEGAIKVEHNEEEIAIAASPVTGIAAASPVTGIARESTHGRPKKYDSIHFKGKKSKCHHKNSSSVSCEKFRRCLRHMLKLKHW